MISNKELFDELATSLIKIYNALEKLRKLYSYNKDFNDSIIQTEKILFIERERIKKLLS